MVSLQALLDDLSDETTTLESILNDLRPAQWSLATPAEGWSIGDQVTHLAYFDEAATLAAMDEDGFRRQAGDLGSRGPTFRPGLPTSIDRWTGEINMNGFGEPERASSLRLNHSM